MSEQERLLPERHDRNSLSVLSRYSSDLPSIRADLWTVLRFRSSQPHRTALQQASCAFEVFILTLILLNVVLAMWETGQVAASPTNSLTAQGWYDTFLYVSTVVFSLEYSLRFWACVEDERYSHPVWGRLKWMLQPMSIIDAIVLIPFYVEIFYQTWALTSYRGVLTLRGFRLLRIMSFLRLERTYNAIHNLRKIVASKKEELGIVTYFTAVIILTSSTTMFFLENDAQPEKFASIGACAYWSVTTMTSVGYGDIVPVTAAGRLFASALALWGMMLFAIPGAVLSSAFVEVMLDRQQLQHNRQEKQAFEQVLRESFSQGAPHIHSGSGPKIRSTQIDSFLSHETLPSDAVQTQLESMQETMQTLLTTQRVMQQQLETQQAQLQAMLKLLGPAVSETRNQENSVVHAPDSILSTSSSDR